MTVALAIRCWPIGPGRFAGVPQDLPDLGKLIDQWARAHDFTGGRLARNYTVWLLVRRPFNSLRFATLSAPPPRPHNTTPEVGAE